MTRSPCLCTSGWYAERACRSCWPTSRMFCASGADCAAASATRPASNRRATTTDRARIGDASDDAVAMERCDLVPAVAELGEDLVRVLAHVGRRCAHHAG